MINRENEQKIKQLVDIEKGLIKKMEAEMQKDRELEHNLLKNYKTILKEEEKVMLTQKVKKIKDEEAWIFLDKESKKLEFLARSLEKKQRELGKNQSLEPLTKKKNGK